MSLVLDHPMTTRLAGCSALNGRKQSVLPAAQWDGPSIKTLDRLSGDRRIIISLLHLRIDVASRERITVASTVGRDLQKRPSA
jgi:hypothetical protein